MFQQQQYQHASIYLIHDEFVFVPFFYSFDDSVHLHHHRKDSGKVTLDFFRSMYLKDPSHSNHYPHKKMLKSFEEDHHRETAWW